MPKDTKVLSNPDILLEKDVTQMIEDALYPLESDLGNLSDTVTDFQRDFDCEKHDVSDILDDVHVELEAFEMRIDKLETIIYELRDVFKEYYLKKEGGEVNENDGHRPV